MRAAQPCSAEADLRRRISNCQRQTTAPLIFGTDLVRKRYAPPFLRKSLVEECFQTPVEGAIYADLVDRLRAQGAIRPSVEPAKGYDAGLPRGGKTKTEQLKSAGISTTSANRLRNSHPGEIPRAPEKKERARTHLHPNACGSLKLPRTENGSG
jgi:hypothetical protein